MRSESLGLIFLAIFFVGCSGDDPVGAESGQVEVTIVTAGDSLDDQYTLAFNTDVLTATILANETLTLELDEGTYSLELTEVADNCAVAGDNPIAVEIDSNVLAVAAFDVTCTQT
jgi:hypothetical protein